MCTEMHLFFPMMSIESKNGNWLLIPTLDNFKLNKGNFFELTNFDGMIYCSSATPMSVPYLTVLSDMLR